MQIEQNQKKKIFFFFTDWPVFPHYKFVFTYVKTWLKTENIKVLKQQWDALLKQNKIPQHKAY